ncbi:MAG TPA: homoserine dehydrogenase [Polyangiaceae bacterium]|nr:homoserine dehydrogenase [Polyangiaceae bacterium]
MSTKPVRIGLLGCGVVGGGVVRLLYDNAAYLAERVGAPLEIARVLVRDADKPREPELDRHRITTDPELVLGDEDIDLYVEVMGGLEPAREYVERAIERKRGVVTANKMLLATNGPELLDRAVAAGVDLAFEASVGGGIPIIRTLREAFAGDWVTSLSGIVNGTCNFVLTRMREQGEAFDVAVRKAQELGYAEADPELDVGGHDAAHKLVVLAMLAFGARASHGEVPTEGIRALEPIDHRLAERFGYAIKHLAIGRDHGDEIELRVHPAFVPHGTPLASVGGVLNAIELTGRALGPSLLIGRGAGAMPTAVSVVADVLDVARAMRSGVAGLATRGIQMARRRVTPRDTMRSRYYLRFVARNEPGTLARIALALGDADVVVGEMVQEEADGVAQIAMMTHEAVEAKVRRALAAIAAQPLSLGPARLIPVVTS